MVKKCAIPGCKSESYAGCGKSFFKFPSEESLRKKRLDAIPSNTNIKNYSVICSLHFRPQDRIVHCSVSKLKSDAVPTTFPKVIPPGKEIAVLSDMVIQAAYYLTARLMSHGKTQTLKIRGQKTNLRQKLHKTVLFSNV